MTLYIKTLTGRMITVDVDYSDTILDLKKKVYQKCGLRPKFQILIYAGKRLENARTISDYNISHRNSTMHLIQGQIFRGTFHFEFDHPIYPDEFRNFSRFKRSLKNESFRNPSNTTPITPLFTELIIPTGHYGPFAKILCFIDPIELLFNQIYISKSFYSVIQEMLRLRHFTFNKYHHYLLFGDHSCVNETLFKKLITSEWFFEKEFKLSDFKIFFSPSQHEIVSGDHFDQPLSTLLFSAVNRGFVDCVEYLLDQEVPIATKQSHGHSIFNICLYSKNIKDEGKRLRIIKLLTDAVISKYQVNNFHGFPSGFFTSNFFKYLYENDQHEMILDFCQRIGKDHLPYCIYHGILEANKKVTWEFFNRLKEVHDFEWVVGSLLRESIPDIEMKLLHHTIKQSSHIDPGLWDALEELGGDFFRFILENEKELKFRKYLPRIHLYLACEEGEVSEIRRILEDSYKIKDDFHFVKDSRYGYFKFHLFDKKIAKTFSNKNEIFQVHPRSCELALQNGKFELAEFLIDKLALESPDISYDLSSLLKELLKNKNEELAVKTFKKFMKVIRKEETSTISFITNIFSFGLEFESERIVRECLKQGTSKKKDVEEKYRKRRLEKAFECENEFGKKILAELVQKMLRKKKKSDEKKIKKDELIFVLRLCCLNKNVEVAKLVLEDEDWEMEDIVSLFPSRRLEINEVQEVLRNEVFRDFHHSKRFEVRCSGCGKVVNVSEDVFESKWGVKQKKQKAMLRGHDFVKKLICMECFEKEWDL